MVCQIGSLDHTDGTLEFDLELGLKQVDLDEYLIKMHIYARTRVDHLLIGLTIFKHRLLHDF